MKVFEQWSAYFSFCIDSPINAPACHAFWTWIMIGAIAFGTIIALYLIWRIIDYKLKLRAALRAQAMRDAVADESTMEQHRWIGDKANIHDDQNAEIRIRAALAARKSKNVEPIV